MFERRKKKVTYAVNHRVVLMSQFLLKSEEESSEWAPQDSDHCVVPIVKCNQQVGDHHEEERVHSYGVVQSQGGKNTHTN